MFLHAGLLQFAPPAKPFSGSGWSSRSCRFTSLFFCSLHSSALVLQHIKFSTVYLFLFQTVVKKLDSILCMSSADKTFSKFINNNIYL